MKGLALAAFLGLAACATPEPPHRISESRPISLSGGEMGSREDVTFFDSDAFDKDLGQAMSDHPTELHMAFAGPTNVNQLPARVNTWLSEVQRTDGRVTMRTAEATPSGDRLGPSIIIDLIDMIMTLRDRKAAATMFGQAKQYDAVILYDSHTGLAKEIVFKRRGQQA
jgi:hypothetical protein